MRGKIVVHLPRNPTPETIWNWAILGVTTDAQAIRRINAAYRHLDDSKKWPVSGRFDATERAIRRLTKARRELPMDPLEYSLALHDEIGRIVNGEV